MKREIRTYNGYDLFEVASALQKSIRRADTKLAGFFALELFASGFHRYAWKRLLTISAEDVEELVTKEICALHYAFNEINTPKPREPKGRIFISKAVVILCKAIKSRETDHLQNLIYDRKMGISDSDVNKMLEQVASMPNPEIPDYAFDVHTRKGKRMGKTKKTFFLEEQKDLLPMGNDEFLPQLQEYIDAI